MSIPFRPIVSALARSRTGAVLVAVQIAIALAVLVNAVYIVKQRSDRINAPTGMDTHNILVVSSSGFTADYDYQAAMRDDLPYMRGVPGVIAATAVNAIPLSQAGTSASFNSRPDNQPGTSQDANTMEVDEQGLATLGLKLIAGRDFRREEVQPPLTLGTASSFVPAVILTRSLADDLYPGQNPVGKTLYSTLGQPATVIGIVEHMQASWHDFQHTEHVMFEPRIPFSFYVSNYYLVRTSPGQQAAVARTLEEHLSRSNPGRTIDWIRPLQGYKDRKFSSDRNMQVFLGTVTALMLAICMLGIFGLATFNVSTRTKQIGTRRAVGARRRDILGYFMVENAMITTAGILAGSLMALGVGYWLSVNYHLPRLDLYYLAAGVPALWLIGQLAVWQPARKAARVSPSVATRTV